MEKDTLIDRLKKGEVKALDRAIKEYSNIAFKVSYNILKDKNEAKEVVQTTFMVMYVHVSKFNGDRELFKNWICTISKRISIERRGLIKGVDIDG